jgi:hypothetical protein
MSDTRRSLNIIACKAIKSGTNAKGREWTIYEVMATKVDGSPVELELRAFDPLPLGVGDYEVEKRSDPKYGDSYTLKIPGGGNRGPQVNPLEQRVAALEQKVALLVAGQGASDPGPGAMGHF